MNSEQYNQDKDKIMREQFENYKKNIMSLAW